ncbi:MAG: hypothetical protein PPP55_12425 [Halorubrum sp.]
MSAQEPHPRDQAVRLAALLGDQPVRGIQKLDAAAAALACDLEATLVGGGDRDFSDLLVGVDVRRFRDDGV